MACGISPRRRRDEPVSSLRVKGLHCSACPLPVFSQGKRQRLGPSDILLGGIVEGKTQVSGASFLHMGIAVDKLPRLAGRGREIGKGQNFIWGIKPREAPTLARIIAPIRNPMPGMVAMGEWSCSIMSWMEASTSSISLSNSRIRRTVWRSSRDFVGIIDP